MNKHIALAENYVKKCVCNGLVHSWDVGNEKYTKTYPEITELSLKYFCDYADNIPNLRIL